MTRVLAGVGFLASLTIAIVSYSSGTTAQLTSVHDRPGIHGASRWVYLAALAVLLLCWLMIGRNRKSLSWQRITTIGAVWAAPILSAAPIASRDVYAYAAQADLYRHDIDPYAHGPLAYGGHYLKYVGGDWVAAPSPYGPVWLVITLAIIATAGSHVLVTVIATRVVCAVGLALAMLTIPRLAERFGGSPVTAAWLFCANPVLVVVTLGGPHNDLLVGGLVSLGLWLATGPGPAWRSLVLPAVVLALAAQIKLPAVAALAFLPWLWLRYAPAAPRWQARRGAVWEISAVVAAIALATAVLSSAATSLGFGWVHQVNSNASGAIVFSMPVLASYVWTLITGPSVDLSLATHVHPHVTTAATALVGLVLVYLWWEARHHDPPRLLAIALAVGVVASTTIHPWYASWALLVAAATVTSNRVLTALAFGSAWSALAVLPNGSSWLAKPPGILIAAIAAVVTVAVLRSSREPGRVE